MRKGNPSFQNQLEGEEAGRGGGGGQSREEGGGGGVPLAEAET